MVTGPHAKPIPVEVRGNQIWPQGRIPAGEKVSIRVVVKHPGWNSWLTGKTETLNLTMRTPSAALRHRFITLKGNAPVRRLLPRSDLDDRLRHDRLRPQAP